MCFNRKYPFVYSCTLYTLPPQKVIWTNSNPPPPPPTSAPSQHIIILQLLVLCCLYMCSLNGSTYTKIGTIQRRLAWPLRKDDTQIREAFQFLFFCGRRSGLMVSVLDSGSGGPGLSPGRGTVLCSWARYFKYSHSASLHPGV